MALIQHRAVYRYFGLSVVVEEPPHPQSPFTIKMGRGAYDTTHVCGDKDSVAVVAIAMHSAKAAEAAKIATVEAAEAAEAKLIRSKKSRGILAARKAAT
ncbi:hypothetical protein G6011_03156 [Alternaria panax]|uniref:Uncharacterized protein n=1 Tax=Alternaria panax TaxID=48097 RepID=A0AAD4IE76_9PLEO|nr:hypothetical protein G6011_03156 [Alternaria panax]